MTPAMNTPQANPTTGRSIRGASHKAAAIMVKFSSTGVIAGIENLPQLFSTLPAKAVREINSR